VKGVKLAASHRPSSHVLAIGHTHNPPYITPSPVPQRAAKGCSSTKPPGCKKSKKGKG